MRVLGSRSEDGIDIGRVDRVSGATTAVAPLALMAIG